MGGHSHDSGFRHAALFYSGEDEYAERLIPFIRAGLEAEEPVLAMVPGGKTDLLREALDGYGDQVRFADMASVGANPARIIPAWREFVMAESEPGRRTRGIGEPIWAGRSPAELVECQRHEALLNLAFDGAADMDLLCPYDDRALEDAVLEEALYSHPLVLDNGSFRDCGHYEGADAAAAPHTEPLPDPPPGASELTFDGGGLDVLRVLVGYKAADAGLSEERRSDLVLAVSELAANSVRHGGGRGVLRLWAEPEAVVAEVRDRGRIDDPLAGRDVPDIDRVGGHGLWLVNQLCDLMQLRMFDTGSVVRVHLRRD